MLSLSVNTQNRITNSGFSYDAAGNMLADGTYNYTWNGENRLNTAAGVTYTYDGLGQRVKKSSGTLYWYGVGAVPLAETDLSGNTINEYILFAGARIARRDASGNVYYYFADHLGSSRTIANSAGAVCYEADFYPVGGERVITNTCGQNYKFAGMERDSETGNDHTWFRYYASNLGRWLSPDPVAGSIFSPQSLNRYAYVLNNPVNLVDPLGLDECTWTPLPSGGILTCPAPPGPQPSFPPSPASPSPSDDPFRGGGGGGRFPPHPRNTDGEGKQGGGGSRTSQGEDSTTQNIKETVCSAIPEGRALGVSGGIGGIGGQIGTLELVMNYNTGEVSGFASGGLQLGWNGGAQGSVFTGFIYGLGDSNTNYFGGATTLSGSAGPFGGFGSLSSGGLTGNPLTLNVNGTIVVGGSVGWNVLQSPFTVGASATNYTKPLGLGSVWALMNPLDLGYYLARQVCK